jgi:hypothetical protein
MRKIEALVFTAILGPIPPVIGLLTGWWGTFAWLPEGLIGPAALNGLALGLLVDLFYLKKWVNQAETMAWPVWLAIYLFYAIGLYGFFMGMPAFHLGLALPAGFIVGVKLTRQAANVDQARRVSRLAGGLTTGVLACLCAASAFLALSDLYTAANLEGMFALNFKVTQPMIIGLIVIGGGVLLTLNGWLTAGVSCWTYTRLLKQSQA